MKSLLAIGLLILSLSLNSTTWASEKEEHGNKATNLFPKPEANKSKAERPAKVTLLEPKALSSVQGTETTLKWQAAENAESYRVQVATDPNFKWLVANEDFYKETSYQVKGLEAGKHYYWRVYGQKTSNDAGYTSSYADFSSFETK